MLLSITIKPIFGDTLPSRNVFDVSPHCGSLEIEDKLPRHVDIRGR